MLDSKNFNKCRETLKKIPKVLLLPLLIASPVAFGASATWQDGSTNITVEEGEYPLARVTVNGKSTGCTTTGLFDFGTPVAVITTNPSYSLSSWLDFSHASMNLTQCGTGVFVYNFGPLSTPPGTTKTHDIYYYWGRHPWMNENYPPALSKQFVGSVTVTMKKLPDIPGCRIEASLWGAGDKLIWVNGVKYPLAAPDSKVSVGGKMYTRGRYRPAYLWSDYVAPDYASYSYETCEVETNKPPAVSNTTLSTPEDAQGQATLIGSDADGDFLSYSLVTGPNPASGNVSISGNKAIFTPAGNWNGSTSFTYKTNDGKVDSNVATVFVTVSPVNDAPSVANTSLAINEDATGALSLGVSDVDLGIEGDSHSWHVVTPPNAAHGAAVITGNSLSFTAKPDWFGTTTMTYRAIDSKGAASNTATITITVNPVNDAPVAAAKSITTSEDTAGSVTMSATDIDSPAPTVFQVVSAPANGSSAISGSTLTFTPTGNWSGSTSLTYRAQDSAGAWSAPVTVTITVNPVNDAPVAVAKSITTNEDTAGSVTLSVVDPDIPYGDSHTYELVGLSANGTEVISGSTLTFTPAADWNGTTSVTYRAKDEAGVYSAAVTVSITVNPVNDVPVAQAKTGSTDEDTPTTVTLTATDIDSPVPAVFQIVAAPNASYGAASITGATLTFTPVANWYGAASMTYRAQDSSGAWSAPVTVTITVSSVNDVPAVTASKLSLKTKESKDVTTKYLVSP